MGDQDAITMCITNVSQQTSNSSSTKKNKPTPKQGKQNNSTPAKKKKGKGKKEKSKKEEPIKTLDEYKAYHSTILSKLCEEVQS